MLHMSMNEALALALREAKNKKKITIKKLAAQAGISITAVTRLLSGTENSTLSTLFAVLAPLGITFLAAAQRAENIYQYSLQVSVN